MGILSDIIFGRRGKTKNINSRVEHERLPRHVAVIMDGNGRWARQKGLPRSAGHRAGVERVRTIIKMSSDIGIRHLTLFAFSTENWKRPAEEVGVLMKLLLEYLVQELAELHQKNVRIKTLGDLSKLPAAVAAEVHRAIETTKDNTGLTVNMAINYGARQEILEAVKKAIIMGRGASEIDEQYFASLLETAAQPDPDLLIRTSGEMRISNFLLYQLAYAELYFTETLWPDFDEAQYDKALECFAKRNRRYGGLGGN